MNAQPFYLICTASNNLAIQAGPTDGTFLTLQPFDGGPLQISATMYPSGWTL